MKRFTKEANLWQTIDFVRYHFDDLCEAREIIWRRCDGDLIAGFVGGVRNFFFLIFIGIEIFLKKFWINKGVHTPFFLKKISKMSVFYWISQKLSQLRIHSLITPLNKAHWKSKSHIADEIVNVYSLNWIWKGVRCSFFFFFIFAC